MKIDRVILSVDNNPTYTVFWNIVSKIWKEKFNINPTLFFHGTEKDFINNNFNVEGCDYKILNNLPEISDPSPNWVVPWSLFWGASLFEDDVCLLSGIDQIPIGNYFFDQLSKIEDDKFVIGFSDAYKTYNKDTLGYFNTKTNVLYPSSHLVGKGKNFKKIFTIEESFEDELNKVYNSKDRYYLNNKFYNDSKLWGLDECYASEKLSAHENKNEIIMLDIFWNYWHPRRIDLNGGINVDFNLELLKNGHYSEVTCKGYEEYKEKMESIIQNITGL